MRRLEKEKQNIKNWHKILMRVQMINAFKLSLRSEDQIEEDKDVEIIQKELAWWESGQIIIYPEKRFGLLWGVFKTLIIIFSLFSFTYQAGFLFSQQEANRN